MNETIHVAVPIPGEALYSYSVPAHLREGIASAKRVLVPFRNRRTIGFIVGPGEPPPGIELRDMLDIIDDEPLFDEKRLEFLKWAADYYMTSLGIVLKGGASGRARGEHEAPHKNYGRRGEGARRREDSPGRKYSCSRPFSIQGK